MLLFGPEAVHILKNDAKGIIFFGGREWASSPFNGAYG
jgi:hypothetical protein